MDKVESSEVWRQIPPEEKIAIMSRAHASGISSCIIVVIIGCTLAVALRLPWLMWGSFVLTPLVFQFVIGKAWRDLRPRVMLEYLGARSAARRYAYTATAKDLTVSMIFRGTITPQKIQELAEESLEQSVVNNQETEVWIALFKDAVIMMSEKTGGAKCEVASLINDKLTLEGMSPDEEGDYSNNRELLLTLAPDRGRPPMKLKVTSPYPAALIVFEKKLLQNLEIAKQAKQKELEAMSHASI